MSSRRVYVEGYGCSLNKAETYYIIAELEKAGFTISDPASADVVVINTCAVKNPTESRMVSRIENFLEMGKRVVVAGCLPDVNPVLLKRYKISVVSARAINRIADAVKKTLSGKIVDYREGEKPGVPVGVQPGITGILPISEGCLGRCAYCGTKNARGDLQSYDPKQIRMAFEKMVREGKKEIFLTAQDTGCYGLDIGTSLPELVRSLLEVDGDYVIRIGMMNPNHALGMLQELSSLLNHPRVYSFLHAPVQSGSDRILKNMRRPYKARDFVRIVDYMRENVPDVTIATDIIVGLPGETETDYHHTIRLLEETRPDVTNVSKFYPRPKTPAEKMPRIRTQVIKRRSKLLSDLVRRISEENNKRYVGRTMRGLVVSEGMARTTNYKTVFFSGKAVPGEWASFRITGAGPSHLKAKVL